MGTRCTTRRLIWTIRVNDIQILHDCNSAQAPIDKFDLCPFSSLAMHLLLLHIDPNSCFELCFLFHIDSVFELSFITLWLSFNASGCWPFHWCPKVLNLTIWEEVLSFFSVTIFIAANLSEDDGVIDPIMSWNALWKLLIACVPHWCTDNETILLEQLFH